MTANSRERPTIAKNIGEKAISAGLGGIIAAILISTFVAVGDSVTRGWLIKQLGGVSQSDFDPSKLKGAVLAFDTPDGCPTGWVEFKDSYGRVLLGAGQNYPYQSRHGTEDIVLDKRHMPSHTHEFWDVYFSEIDDSPPSKEVKMFDVPGKYGQKGPRDQDNKGWAFLHSTGSIGEGKPYTNMQPYLALYFCKYSIP